MPDLAIGPYGWSGDLALTVSGDIMPVDGSDLGVQRVIRRLLTAENAVLFHADYGAGLLAKIGSPIPARRILGIVRSQMFREAAVSQEPPPNIAVNEIPAGSGRQVVSIHYQDRQSGAPMVLSFDQGS